LREVPGWTFHLEDLFEPELTAREPRPTIA
jgi:hypothetical protein